MPGTDKPAKPVDETVSTPVGTGAAEGVQPAGSEQPMTAEHSGKLDSDRKPPKR